jgi:hypothetical protein
MIHHCGGYDAYDLITSSPQHVTSPDAASHLFAFADQRLDPKNRQNYRLVRLGLVLFLESRPDLLRYTLLIARDLCALVSAFYFLV